MHARGRAFSREARVAWFFGGAGLALGAAWLAACVEPPRSRASGPFDLGYPTCDGRALPEGTRIASGWLRAGPTFPERSVSERFEIRRRDCVIHFTGRQDWTLSTIDLDVMFDAQTLRPLRVWKRIASPGGRRARVEVRRFEMRGPRVALTQRTVTGVLEHWWIRGPSPSAVIGPGRGLLTLWLRRARLPVGGRVREPVLDIRENMEVVRDVTLARLDDRDDPVLGRVRVYTIFGREPVYADDEDVVVGDMMGLVPGALVGEAAPNGIALGPPDPTGTP